ncbi:M23 family metallopeptidase [Nocardioides sp. GY 10113]|uniref:M23 family metallopeptidase n=1 Tax=Nocardioides sp. GY 10113 TaxID=2569761 RepID=UPI0010A87425|nr:M23 family metallopeptidase [Nocardioides sp. GY 10113]TIC88148.1 M23 family metallopeptidase [Nocardioides sp. GY 10113]
MRSLLALRRSSRLAALALLLVLLALAAVPPAATADPDPVATWPLRPAPAVAARFDPPGMPYGAGHRGVDLVAAPGATVRAALPGRVSFAGRVAGRGVVVVDHGATRTTYQPVTAVVRVGQEVTAGDALGRLGLVGSHCFPRACLHWGLIAGETYLDPLSLVGAAPVRLLPLWSAAPALDPRFTFTLGPAPASAPGLDPPLRLVGAPVGRRAAAGPW